MMVLIEKEKLEQFQKDIDSMKNEIEKQNRKILEIIDAFEIVFKRNKELNEEGFPSYDWEEVQDADYEMRRAVIENIEYGIKTSVKEILAKYRGIKDYESKKWKCGKCKWLADNGVCKNVDSPYSDCFVGTDSGCGEYDFKEDYNHEAIQEFQDKETTAGGD